MILGKIIKKVEITDSVGKTICYRMISSQGNYGQTVYTLMADTMEEISYLEEVGKDEQKWMTVLDEIQKSEVRPAEFYDVLEELI